MRSRLRVILTIAWWLVSGAILAWGKHLYGITTPSMRHHVDEAILFWFLVITFPTGLVMSLLIALAFAFLEKAFGIEVPGGIVTMTLTALAISSAGWWQWFVFLPRVLRRAQAR